MRLQKILNKLQKLHPKEIDLSLERTKTLLEKLGNPQHKIKVISVVGTNGKNSTINAIYSILKEANFKCNVYTSPHVLKINERFVFNNKELNDNDLADLFEKVEKINKNNYITYFEILTACFFYKAAKYPNNINLVEAGLFHRFDATNILSKNLASVITSISLDHLDWLPKNKKNIKKIVYEKTSSLLNSSIIIAKQSKKSTMNCIKRSISSNKSKKIYYCDDFNFFVKHDQFFYYKDRFGKIKLPTPNLLGRYQLENISTAISTIRNLKFDVKLKHIRKGITKLSSLARLQEVKKGKLKKLVKNNRLIIDGSHNENGSQVLNEYLQSLNCKIHVMIGMMANKHHEKYISYFKNISSFTFLDIPNQPNAMSGKDLERKFKHLPNVKYQPNIMTAIKSINLGEGDILLITGSLYLAGEVLSLN